MNGHLVKGMRRILEAFEKKQVMRLRETSNSLIEEAALKNDEVLAEMSVLAYSLHKIVSKPHIAKHREWERTKKRIILLLNQAISLLERNDRKGFREKLESVSKSVKGVDEFLSHFIQSVHEKAKVKQASRAYAMGLSLSSAASLTGAEKRHVLHYIGRTDIHDKEKEGVRMEKRMKRIREVFK